MLERDQTQMEWASGADPECDTCGHPVHDGMQYVLLGECAECADCRLEERREAITVTSAQAGPGRGSCLECGALIGNYHREGCPR